MKTTLSNTVRKLSRGRKSRRKPATPPGRRQRSRQFEGLEKREMFSVSNLWFNGNMLVVKADNASTSVAVSQVGSNIRVSEVGTTRTWDYLSSIVGSVEFQGGWGNDRFVNNVMYLPVRGFGGAGNDYLEGYHGADTFVGGDGDDTILGYGGNDGMWGGNGNDVILGGAGNDQLLGEAGNDRLNGQAGNDQHWAGDGNDVVVSIDSAFGDYVEGGAGADIVWIDRYGASRDNSAGNTVGDMVQEVAYFTNGADRTLDGDRIADPTDSGSVARFDNVNNSNPLFSSSGPRMDDIKQGSVNDCYVLAGLGAIARDNPHALRQNVVDFDDGTYGVRLGNNFYRVDNDLPVHAGTRTPMNAQLGAQNSMWVAVVEKAFAHYRTGANTYASLNFGWSEEVNRAFRSLSVGWKEIRSYTSAAALANDVAARAGSYQAVTIGFVGSLVGGVPLVPNHMYTVASVTRNSAGVVTAITLRNPWATDGANTGDGRNDGYVTLTPAQIFAQGGRVNWGRV
jgi:hypothetical protein